MEHWNLKDGKFKGLYAIDPLKGRFSDKWARIENAIQEYTKLHPQEMAEALLDVEYHRQAQINQYGASSSGIRHGAMLPPGLGFKLEIIDPELFTNRNNLHEFLKRFPGFRVYNTI
jgi:hypothetical protein